LSLRTPARRGFRPVAGLSVPRLSVPVPRPGLTSGRRAGVRVGVELVSWNCLARVMHIGKRRALALPCAVFFSGGGTVTGPPNRAAAKGFR